MDKLNLRIPPDLRQRLDTQATADRRSLNSEILHLLEVGLNAVSDETANRADSSSPSPVPRRNSSHSHRR